MIRVVVTGSECTGKTTLVLALAEHYGCPWVPEVVRAYVDEKGAAPVYGDVDPIARRQLLVAKPFEASAGELLLFDTDLLSTWIYSNHYYGDCPGWIGEAVEERRGDLYLLAGIDIPWEPDGFQRDRGHMREEMQALFRNELLRRSFPFVEVEGSHTRRMRRAVGVIDWLRGTAKG